jgi:hypothetical protein
VSTPDAPESPSTPDPADRHAYLEEQLRRQKAGEPVDVEWVRAELVRVREEQASRMATSQRNLRWLVIAAAVTLLVLWFRNNQPTGPAGIGMLALVALGLVATLLAGRRRR